MSAAPPPDPSPAEAQTAELRRTRRIVLLSAAFTLLVMGGVIALALASRREGPAGGPTDPWEPAPREAWPAADCIPDPARPSRLALDVDAQGIDFGVVNEGQVITREVGFRNEGEGPLCIQKVDTTCGCVSVRLKTEQRRFEPGTGGAIEVILNSAGRSGRQHKDISVYSNDFQNPRVSFPVKVDITAPVLATPTQLNFGRVTAQQPATATVTLRGTTGPTAWEVTGVRGVSRPGVPAVPYTFEVRSVPGEGSQVKDVVITHPGLEREDIFQDTVTITTTHPDKPEISLPAYLVVVAPILVAPPQATLGFVEEGSTNATRVRLVPASPEGDFQILGVELRGRDGAQVAGGTSPFRVGTPVREEGMWVLEVSYDGKARSPGVYPGLIVVKTDHARMPEVHVPCYATVKGGD